MASDCTYKKNNFKQRDCKNGCSGKKCNGSFSCKEDGTCTLSVPYEQTMILDEDNLTPQVLCYGALKYECEDQNNWPGICDPKYLKGAVQFSSTVVKDCTTLVNQGRYNRDNMECTCTACQDCGFGQCGQQRLYCDCSVKTFPLGDVNSTISVEVTTTTSNNSTDFTDFNLTEPGYTTSTSVSTHHMNITREPGPSSMGMTTVRSTHTTEMDSASSSSVIANTSSQNGHKNSNKALPHGTGSSGITSGVLGGIFGGLIIFLIIILLALLILYKRIQKRKGDKKRNAGGKATPSSTHSTGIPNQIPMSSMISQHEEEYSYATQHDVISAAFPQQDHYYSSSNYQDKANNYQNDHTATVSQDEEYDFAQPVLNNKQPFSNEVPFDSTRDQSEQDVYVNTKSLETTDHTIPNNNDEVYNVLNEPTKQIKESNEDYGHLREVGDAQDQSDQYDELHRPGQKRFAEPDDLYDHT